MSNQRMLSPEEAERERIAKEVENAQLYNLIMEVGDMLIDHNNKVAAIKQHAIDREASERRNV